MMKLFSKEISISQEEKHGAATAYSHFWACCSMHNVLIFPRWNANNARYHKLLRVWRSIYWNIDDSHIETVQFWKNNIVWQLQPFMHLLSLPFLSLPCWHKLSSLVSTSCSKCNTRKMQGNHVIGNTSWDRQACFRRLEGISRVPLCASIRCRAIKFYLSLGWWACVQGQLRSNSSRNTVLGCQQRLSQDARVQEESSPPT